MFGTCVRSGAAAVMVAGVIALGGATVSHASDVESAARDAGFAVGVYDSGLNGGEFMPMAHLALKICNVGGYGECRFETSYYIDRVSANGGSVPSCAGAYWPNSSTMHGTWICSGGTVSEHPYSGANKLDGAGKSNSHLYQGGFRVSVFG